MDARGSFNERYHETEAVVRSMDVQDNALSVGGAVEEDFPGRLEAEPGWNYFFVLMGK